MVRPMLFLLHGLCHHLRLLASFRLRRYRRKTFLARRRDRVLIVHGPTAITARNTGAFAEGEYMLGRGCTVQWHTTGLQALWQCHEKKMRT